MSDVFSFYDVDASYIVATVLVAMFAANRFNTPRTARSQTSRFQYFSSCAAYVASCLGLLMVLTWLLGHNPGILGLLHFGAASPIPQELQGLDKPLVAALVLTAVLPTFPWLSEVDARMLRFFHKIGSIPFGAVRWAQQMKEARFIAPASLLADTRNFIDNSPMLPERLIDELQPDPDAEKPRYRFTRNMGLYVTITNLRSRARFADDYPDDIAAFEKRMAGFFAQSVGFFALSGQLARQPTDAAADAIHNAQEAFHGAALDIYEDLRLMLARVLLYSSRGENEVSQRLREIGFNIKRPAPVHIPVNLLMLDLIGVVAIFVVTAVGTSYMAGAMSLSRALVIGFLVAVNQCIAAIFALLPKQVWGFADIRCAKERPVLAYVISSICTLTINLPIAFTFYQFRLHFLADPAHPFLPFLEQCKWLLMSGVMAFALAFACDDFAVRDTEPDWVPWVEAAAGAVIIAATGLLVLQWLRESGFSPAGSSQRFWTPILVGASIGALFGGTIPQWYRRMLRQSLQREPAMSPRVGGLAPVG